MFHVNAAWRNISGTDEAMKSAGPFRGKGEGEGARVGAGVLAASEVESALVTGASVGRSAPGWEANKVKTASGVSVGGGWVAEDWIPKALQAVMMNSNSNEAMRRKRDMVLVLP
jgi:hypothetical protein